MAYKVAFSPERIFVRKDFLLTGITYTRRDQSATETDANNMEGVPIELVPPCCGEGLTTLVLDMKTQFEAFQETVLTKLEQLQSDVKGIKQYFEVNITNTSAIGSSDSGPGQETQFRLPVKNPIDLDYSVSNPLSHAPKRRGRPKRDLNAPVVPRKKVVDIAEFPEKPKRVTKPPIRYGDQVVDIKDEETEPVVENEISKDPYMQFIENESSSSPDKAKFLGDVGLLNFEVIMQEDGYVQPVEVIRNVRTEKADDDGNSSDASVRTIDFVQNKQKKRRRKKRKRKVGVKKIKEQIRCPIPNCNFVSCYKASLNYHHQRVHEKTIRFTCQVCNQGFTHEKLLKLHHLSHSQERKFKCNECIAKFKSKSSLFTHRRTVHLKAKDFKCDICEMKFTLKSTLTAHKRVHDGSKPHSCKVCKKSFTQGSNLRAHVRTHTGDKPFKCDWEGCSKAFITSTQFKLHKRSHEGGKPYLCAKCGKGFASHDAFKYHENKHSGLKPFKCEKCDSSFPTPWGHKRHVKLHAQEKPYKCNFCEQAFKDPSNLNKHIKSHDKKESQLIEEQETVQVQAERMLEMNADDLLKLNGIDENGQVLYFSPETFSSFPPYVTITVGEDNQAIVDSDNQITLESLGMTFTLDENGGPDYFTLTGADPESIQDQIGIDNGIKLVLQGSSPEHLLQEALALQLQQEQLGNIAK